LNRSLQANFEHAEITRGSLQIGMAEKFHNNFGVADARHKVLAQVFWNKLDAALELLFFDLPERIQSDFESQTGRISARTQAFARRNDMDRNSAQANT
jgi:hypothetical protein